MKNLLIELIGNIINDMIYSIIGIAFISFVRNSNFNLGYIEFMLLLLIIIITTTFFTIGIDTVVLLIKSITSYVYRIGVK